MLNCVSGGHFQALAYGISTTSLCRSSTSLPLAAPAMCRTSTGSLPSRSRFQQDQVEILRATHSNWFIFHKLGRLDDIDVRGDFRAISFSPAMTSAPSATTGSRMARPTGQTLTWLVKMPRIASTATT